jgi:hypothetical protein
MKTESASLSLPALLPPALPQPTLLRMSLTFVAEEEVHFPAYAGSTWRGAFGHALRQQACVTKAKTCDGCTLLASCPYPYVFETARPSTVDVMRRYASVPHPFVLRLPEAPQQDVARGASHELDIVLIGRAEAHAALVAAAFGLAGEHGVGSNRGRLRLSNVAAERVPLVSSPTDGTVPPSTTTLKVTLITPLRMLRDGKLVSPEQFAPGDWLFALAKRMSLLGAMHETARPAADVVDFVALKQALAGIQMIDARLRWHDWARISSRQNKSIEMGGIVGSFSLDAIAIAPFFPLLRWGEWGHVGKGTSMGLGGYRLDGATSL